MKQIFIWLIAALLSVILGMGVHIWLSRPVPQVAGIEGFFGENARALRDFSLVDHHEQVFNLARIKGRWNLLFFGYTHCPDICPIALNTLRNVKKYLQEKQPTLAAELQYIFVSVDGQRDTPSRLRDYVGYFDPDFLGVTGNDQQVIELTRQLGILYFRVAGTTAENYLVDHSSGLILIDPQGRFAGLFSAPHVPEEIATRYIAIRQWVAATR